MRRLLIPIISLAAIAVSCSDTPKEVIGQEKLAHILADIHTGESVVEQHKRQYSTDSLKRVLKQSILLSHDVTSEQLDTSLKWYGYHTDRYIELYDRVIEILEEEIDEAQSSAGTSRPNGISSTRFAIDGDSVDVWTDAKWRYFSRTAPSDIMFFALTSDQHWERGDIYELSARMTSAPGITEMNLVTEYQNGSKEYTTLHSPASGWKRLRLALDPERPATSVYGTLRYIPSGDERALADSITLVRRRVDSSAAAIRAGQKQLSNRYGR